MTLLGGRYTLDVPLGDSDLGTVWNAHDDTGTPLVVVTLEDDAPAPLQDRFRAHGKALVKTAHPSLVRAIAEGEENGAPYLVLERLTGESLAARLEAGPALTVTRVVEIAIALAEGLAAVHAAGIAHGDVEPGNVLLVTEGGKDVPKLIGFGLNRASLRQELGVRMSQPSLGPVAYAAPEQARGDVLDGPLADQASLAAIVYAALGGRTPHIARDIAALATAIGNDKPTLLSLVKRDLAPFASTLDRALSTDPKKRFPDMTHFARALKTAGSLARAIAATTVPLGARSAIGEPPAPALPRGATISKPGGALGAARVPGPGKAVIPKPSATSTPHPAPAAPASEDGSRTTQELATGDLLPLAAEPEQPVATSTPQPPPKAPAREPHSARVTEELDASELHSIPPAATPPVTPSGQAPRDSLPELASAELDSLPPGPPAETPHAPPPPPHAPPPPPPPHAPTAEASSAAAAAKPDAKPSAKAADAIEPSVAFSPSMEKIVAAAAEQKAASAADDDDVPSLAGAGGARPWLVPAALAGVAILAIVSWFGYRATQSDAEPEVAGHTLTVTPPSPTTTAPATTIVAPPPDTTVPVTTVPPTTVAPPPETEVEAPPPPATRVTPPPATRVTPPPATRVTPPPATRVTPPTPRTPRTPPPTTSARTPTRPPPTTTTARTPAHPPPTTTARRPTVVSDPGF